jgi:ABC-type branched-subunit amino acid transport system substrate-binding protein
VTAAGDRGEAILATKPDVDITGSKDPNAIVAVHALNQEYPHVGPTDYTFAAYDCADILIAVIERAIELKGGNLPNRRDVLDAMQTITYVGLTGTYSFDHNGDALSPLMSIYQVHNGKWEYLQKLDATAAG